MAFQFNNKGQNMNKTLNEKEKEIFSKLDCIVYVDSIEFNVDLRDFDKTIEKYKNNYGDFIIKPYFYRGETWSVEKQIAFIESLLSHNTTLAARTITLNSPVFYKNKKNKKSDLPDDVFCVDGSQRITALLAFIRGDFKIFEKELGGVDLKYFSNTQLTTGKSSIKIQIMNIQTSRELTKFYESKFI